MGKRARWDPNFRSGKTLKKFEGGYSVEQWLTNPVLSVSSREFIDFLCVRDAADGRSFTAVYTSPTPEVLPGLPPPVKGVVRAINKVGTGCRFSLVRSEHSDEGVDTHVVCLEIVTESEVNGWLPVSLVTRSTSIILSRMHAIISAKLK